MIAIHEIRQMIWLDTPKGLCLAKFMIDRGPDSDMEWVTFHQETGAILNFDNADVLAHKNFTLARRVAWDDLQLPGATPKPKGSPHRYGSPNSMSRLLRQSKRAT